MRLLDRPAVRERIAQALASTNAHPPWKTQREAGVGCVFDARGEEVAVVDPNNRFTNTQADSLATLICVAVNLITAEGEVLS